MATDELRLVDLPHDHQQCQACGGAVSTAYRRVFGRIVDGADVVFGCPDCTETRGSPDGLADPGRVFDREEVTV